MSFREKIAWVSVVLTLLVWGSYFATLMQRVAQGNLDGGKLAGMFIGSVITLIILQIVFSIAAALITPREADAPPDERDQLIAAKANSSAFMVLNVCVLCVAGIGPFVAMMSGVRLANDASANASLLMANGILLSVVIAELVKSGGVIFRYRSGR